MGVLEMKVTSHKEEIEEDSIDYKIGDIVRWCWSEEHRSTYFIVNITKKGALLKQNFGMGQILTSEVPLPELKLDY
jgi:hypothetical protein